MNALTICQPYAHFICLPESDPMHKLVENRTWPTRYRGPLAIHAGKSRSWLEGDDLARWLGMAFGAVVAVADLVACIHILDAEVSGTYIDSTSGESVDLAWLDRHVHSGGPWCWVLRNVRTLKPIPCSGAQGIWTLPADIAAQIAGQIASPERRAK